MRKRGPGPLGSRRLPGVLQTGQGLGAVVVAEEELADEGLPKIGQVVGVTAVGIDVRLDQLVLERLLFLPGDVVGKFVEGEDAVEDPRKPSIGNRSKAQRLRGRSL